MKKLLALLLVASMLLLSLAACGEDEKKSDPTTKPSTVTPTEDSTGDATTPSAEADPSATQPEADPSATQPEADPSATQPEADPSATQPEADPSATQPEADPSATQPTAEASQPAQSAEPSQPAQSAEPSQPAQPTAEPSQPSAEPSQPSAEPSQPAQPSQPSQPSTEYVEWEEDVVYKHTAVLDGKLDDAYLLSHSFSTDYLRDGKETSRHTAYVLWDGEWIYVCVVIDENDLISRGEGYINAIDKNGNNNPWANDAVDLWYAFNGVIPDTKDKTWKVGYDMMGVGSGPITEPSAGIDSDHFADCAAKATYTKNFNPNDADGYVDRAIVEFKLPAKAEGSDDLLQADDEVWFAVQINDIADGEGDPDPANSYSCVWGKGAQNGRPNAEGNNCWTCAVLSDTNAADVIARD